MTIGENIRKARTAASQTQKELAEKIDTTTKDVSRWENGSRTPNATTLKKICEALNVSADSILELGEGAENENSNN